MRFALPAVAATSGLGLLILAFYGQPAAYLRQAREQLHAVFVSPPDDPPADRNNIAFYQRMARLQQEVERLEKELNSKQVPPPVASPPPRAPDLDPSRVARPIKAAPPSIAVPERNEIPRSPMPPPAVTPQEVLLSRVAPQGVAPAAAAPSVSPSRTGPVPTPVPPRAIALEAPQTRPEPAKPEPAKPEPAKPEPTRAEPVRAEPTRAEPARAQPTRVEPTPAEAPKPGVEKFASVKPAAPPLVSSQNPAPRPDTDDTKSVLARLRQQPAAPPVPQQQPEAPQASEARPPRPSTVTATASPFVPRLTAARTALGNGRTEAARRLLQEAQLQLVFRPVDSPAEETSPPGPSTPGPSISSRTAANVARALEALSVNDIPLSRRYIDAAVNDLSGTATDTPIQQSERRTPGYAPAYPPR